MTKAGMERRRELRTSKKTGGKVKVVGLLI